MLRSAAFLRPSVNLWRCYSSGRTFESAQTDLKTLSESPDNDTKLKLYALYKQATSGDVTGKAPSMLNFVERAKFDAWTANKGLSTDEAKKQYVDFVYKLVDEDQKANAAENADSSSGIAGLKITIENGVYRIDLNRPKKFNALTMDMYEGIIKCLEEADNNKGVRFVVIAGTGDYYCSGNDLSNFEQAATIGKEKLADISADIFNRFVTAFIDFKKPVIGLVNGPAVGISVTLLPLFNLVLASDSATFHTPFATLGQTAEGTSSYTFPRLMGALKASEVLLFSRKLTAQEAYERNLVNDVIPRAHFFAEANKRVAMLAKLPPQTMVKNKFILREVDRAHLHEVNKREVETLKQSWLSKECEEALMAFMTRKK